MKRQGKNSAVSASKSTSKYRNIAQTINNIRFDSKAEAARYTYNLLRIEAGDLAYQLMQVPFNLPGGIKYRVDFMEVGTDGNITYIDVKGKVTEVFRIKKKQVEALYPIKVVCVRRKSGYNFREIHV
jgi:hypothetical protein